MVKPKKYDYTEIEYEYFDLDLCLQKAQILNLLEKSTPQKVRRFNSNGTYWVFDDVLNCFKIVINGGELYLTEYVATFMIFMDFILELLCFNDKRLICPFEDEGYFSKVYNVDSLQDCLWADESQKLYLVIQFSLVQSLSRV